MPRPKRARLRLSYFERLRAIVLLRKGKKREQIVRELRKRYHPEHAMAQVERAYFPSRGPFSLREIEEKRWPSGVPEVFMAKVQPIMRSSIMRGKMGLKKLHGDPVLKAKMLERLRQKFRDPNYRRLLVTRGRRIMALMRANPEFIRRWRAGRQAYLQSVRLGKTIKPKLVLGKQIGFEGGKPVRVTQPVQEHRVYELERQHLLSESLKILPPQGAEIVKMFFGLFQDDFLTVKEIAKRLHLSEKEVQNQLNVSLQELRQNKALQALYDELK